MRIAMLGTRGVPARYGGFETAVEEIGRRLADGGHRVVVYCRTVPGAGEPPVQVAVEVAAVLIVVLLPRHRSTRLWALGLVLPMWWLADRMIGLGLYGTGILG